MSFEARSPAAIEYRRRLHHTRRWREIRAAHLRNETTCRMCREAGRVTAATIVDHIKPHRGDAALFYDPQNLQSLCKTHHDGTKRRLELGGKPRVPVGADGWPVG